MVKVVKTSVTTSVIILTVETQHRVIKFFATLSTLTAQMTIILLILLPFFRSFLLELKERVLPRAIDENTDQQEAVVSLLGALGGLRSPMSPV